MSNPVNSPQPAQNSSVSHIKHKSSHLTVPNSSKVPSTRSQSPTLCSQKQTTLSFQLSNQTDEIEYWKQSYLKLERIHQETVNELQNQLQQKEEEILELQKGRNDEERMVRSQQVNGKQVQKAISMRQEVGREREKQKQKGVDYLEQDSIVDSFNPRELDLENQLAYLHEKLEEMEIEKRYSQIKEQEWMESSLSLNKELKRMKSRHQQPKFDKAVNTDTRGNDGIDNPETQQTLSINYLKNRLLKLMEANVRLTKQLKQDSLTTQAKSVTTTPTKPSEPSTVGLSKILGKPLDLSKISTNKNTSSSSLIVPSINKSNSDRLEKESTQVNKTFSPCMTPTKLSSLSGRTGTGADKEKWLVLKKSLEELKTQNKVLRSYMEMK